jgi:hypothetical protein
MRISTIGVSLLWSVDRIPEFDRALQLYWGKVAVHWWGLVCSFLIFWGMHRRAVYQIRQLLSCLFWGSLMARRLLVEMVALAVALLAFSVVGMFALTKTTHATLSQRA